MSFQLHIIQHEFYQLDAFVLLNKWLCLEAQFFYVEDECVDDLCIGSKSAFEVLLLNFVQSSADFFEQLLLS